MNERISLRDHAKNKFALSEGAYSFILMVPLLTLIFITMVYPLFYGLQLSFTDIRMIGTKGNFVGLDNFVRNFKDPVFISALKNSLLWTVGNAILQTIFGFSVGLLLSRPIIGRNVMRVWILLPWIVPSIAIAILWKWLLSATYGIVNHILLNIGLLNIGIPFLGSVDLALITCIFINSWRWFPFLSIIILAGILSIPNEEYEAAKMDGAGFWQELKIITFPHLLPTLVIQGLIGLLMSFNMFDILWLMTQGGPAGATRTLAVLVYEQAFRQYFLGRAGSVGVIMLLVLLIVLVLYLKVNKSALGLFAPIDDEEVG